MSEGQILQTLLEKYQVRKNQRQKADFFRFAQAVCHSAGYLCEIEEAGKRTVSRNIIAGNPETARVIFTAHYDTCAEMPLPNLVYPRSMFLTFLAQMPLILIMAALAVGVVRLVIHFAPRPVAMIAGYAVYFGLLFLFFYGPANPHTANDNTSGVSALMEIMAAVPPDKRTDAAFIFFDNEEKGKVGSKAYHKAHPGITEGKVLLNLDCVGDGDEIFVVAPKNADEALIQLLKAVFQDGNGKRAVLHGDGRKADRVTVSALADVLRAGDHAHEVQSVVLQKVEGPGVACGNVHRTVQDRAEQLLPVPLSGELQAAGQDALHVVCRHSAITSPSRASAHSGSIARSSAFMASRKTSLCVGS